MSESPRVSLEPLKQCVTTPKRPVRCPDCGKGFSRQPDMSRHITPKITCPIGGCHKPFRKDKENEFMIHVEREHPGFDSQVAEGYFKGMMPNCREKYCYVNATSQPIKTYPFHYLAFVPQMAPKESLPSLILSRHQHTSLDSRPCQRKTGLSTISPSVMTLVYRATHTMELCHHLNSITLQAGKIQCLLKIPTLKLACFVNYWKNFTTTNIPHRRQILALHSPSKPSCMAILVLHTWISSPKSRQY
jgi:hypothetical protein